MKRAALILAWIFGAHTAFPTTLDSLMEMTVENDPEIQAARHGLDVAAGQRLVFRSNGFPDIVLGVAGGDQGGHRAGQDHDQLFGFGYGSLGQPFFNMAVPPSRRRGDVELAIAQQRLNVAVAQELHVARVAFYTAVYNRALSDLQRQQVQRLQDNLNAQKNRYENGLASRADLVSAEVQLNEVVPRSAATERAYQGALVQLRQMTGHDVRPEGELRYQPVAINVAKAAERALAERPDLKLARVMVRAGAEDQRVIAAEYYPVIGANSSGDYIPVSSVRREESSGSPRRSDNIVSSESRTGGVYSWRVIDNGKVGGAVARQRAVTAENAAVVEKMERDIPRELQRIRNDLDSIATNEQALRGASGAADQNATTLQQNLSAGVASQLEYRLAQNDLLDVQTALLTLAYKQQVDLAEWDCATGRYLRFVDDHARDVR